MPETRDRPRRPSAPPPSPPLLNPQLPLAPQIPPVHVPPVQQSAVVVQVWPPRPQVAQVVPLHRQPAQHWSIPLPQAPPP